jgi:hypothetical protein
MGGPYYRSKNPIPRPSADSLPCPQASPFCDKVQESITHLLYDCVLARMVWPTCLRWWDKEDHLPIQGVLPSSALYLNSSSRAANTHAKIYRLAHGERIG